MHPAYYAPQSRGGLLPLHLSRLGAALHALSTRTRAAVAQALAEAAAELVGDAVRIALASPASGRGSGHWQDNRRAFRDPWQDEYDDRYGVPRDYPEEDWEDDEDAAEALSREAPRCLGWPVGLALAVRLAALGLGQRPGSRPLLKALAVGTAGVAVAVVGGPLAVAALRLLECLLSLADLEPATQS